eukprot:12731577-Ditylum_brightwellii.AAC.1
MRREALGLISNQQSVSSRPASTRIKSIYLWEDASGWTVGDGQQYLCWNECTMPLDPSHDDGPSQGDAITEYDNQPSSGDTPRDNDYQQERMDDIDDDNQLPEPDATEKNDDITLDNFGLPKGHTCATDIEVVDNKYATIIHLSWFQCASFGQYSFAETQHIPRKLQPTWAETVGRVARDAVEALQQAHLHECRNKCALDRHLKMWLLLPFLLLCNPPPTQ